jgi:AcrR family transcriptional regulator
MVVYAFRLKSRPPAPPTTAHVSRRVRQRRERPRARLLAVGARQLAARGRGLVSIEELLAEADGSRATFGLFLSKYSLLQGILNPMVELATLRVCERRARPPVRGLLLRAH